MVKLLDFGSVKDKNKDAKKLTVLGTTIGSPYYMAPEQAQGLDTLDARADVFALAAITYECITGHVPFDGTNGPSILLAIMTKDPIPPTKRGADGRYPVPPALDDVLEEALVKNPNIRTRTVGALADAVGRAYGLDGDHNAWARTPTQDLEQRLAESIPRVMAPRPQAAMAQADPFASPAGGSAGGPASMGGQGMQDAFAAARAAEYGDASAGLPPRRPAWVLAVAVGVAALLVGGGIALAMMLAR